MTYFHHWGNFPDIHMHLKPLVEQNNSRTYFCQVLSVTEIARSRYLWF